MNRHTLVIAAGLTERGDLVNSAEELVEWKLALNTYAPFLLMQDTAKVTIRQNTEDTLSLLTILQ